MTDVIVEISEAHLFDEHRLEFSDDGSVEADDLWRLMATKVSRLPAGQDFVIAKLEAEHGCELCHFYDGVLQEKYEGTDDILDFIQEFVGSKRRIKFVRRTRRR